MYQKDSHLPNLSIRVKYIFLALMISSGCCLSLGWTRCQKLPLSQAYLKHQSLRLIERVPVPDQHTSPIVIGLHGLGHHKEGFSRLAKALPKHWRLIFIDAPFRYGRGYAWYRFKCPEREEDLTFSTHALMRRVTDLKKRYPHAPIALFGFSQGGVMTLSALEHTPQLWSSAASLSGYWGYVRSPQLSKEKTPNLLIVHGRNDQVVPLHRGQNAIELLRQVGVQVTPFFFSGGHQINAQVLASMMTHFQLGFAQKTDIDSISR